MPNGLPYLVFRSYSNQQVLFPQPIEIPTVELSSKISGYYNRSVTMQSEMVRRLPCMCTVIARTIVRESKSAIIPRDGFSILLDSLISTLAIEDWTNPQTAG